MTYALPIVFALFIWWFSTGIIFYLDSLPVRTFKWSMVCATAVLAASLYGVWVTSADTTMTGAYVAFVCGVLMWGWQEMSLYMGFVTGPRKHRCSAGCSGWPHFLHAIQVNLWHEIAIVVGAALVVVIAWDAPNQIGMWTFLVLWWMHLSARLNVFLGVRNVSEEFVPAHMDVLKSFLTRKPMNLLFPVSVTSMTVATAVLFDQAASAASQFQLTGFVLLATLTSLALFEHWLLILPLPIERLWSWSLSRRERDREIKDTPPKYLELKML